MTGHQIRDYTRDGFSAVPAPEWFHEAIRLCAAGRDWHHALARVPEASDNGLTGKPLGTADCEIIFWRSERHGTYVEIVNVLGVIE